MLSKKSKWSCRKFFVDGNSDPGKVQCTINLPPFGRDRSCTDAEGATRPESLRQMDHEGGRHSVGDQLALESGYETHRRGKRALALKLSGFGQRGGMWFARAALFLCWENG